MQGLLGVAGVSASLSDTGQQWDQPNAWPPLQDIMIEALENCGELRSMSVVNRNFQLQSEPREGLTNPETSQSDTCLNTQEVTPSCLKTCSAYPGREGLRSCSSQALMCCSAEQERRASCWQHPWLSAGWRPCTAAGPAAAACTTRWWRSGTLPPSERAAGAASTLCRPVRIDFFSD